MLKEQWVFEGVWKETRDVVLYAVERRDGTKLESVYQNRDIPGYNFI